MFVSGRALRVGGGPWYFEGLLEGDSALSHLPGAALVPPLL